ncbi:hypothetical protein Tco_0323481 [Tanacetum coccineum]
MASSSIPVKETFALGGIIVPVGGRFLLWTSYLKYRKGKARLLDTTIGRIVPLLPVAPDRAGSELEASVEKLFDEGGSGNQTEQEDSTEGGQDDNIQPVVEAADTAVEDVAPVQPRRQRKRKYVIMDTGGKSRSAIKRLLAGAVLNVEVGVAAIPTLPFVTASVSTTPERENGDHTDSVAELNLHTIGAPPRFVISSDSSHHSGTNVAEAEVDSFVRSSVPIITTVTTITSTVDPTSVAKEKLVEPSPFCAGSSSAGGNDPTTGVFSDLTVYVPQWSVTNGFRLDNGRVCREMVDEFAPLKFFTSVRGMEHDQLFTEFNVGSARQMSLSVEVREEEIENLKVQLLLREAEAAEAIRLRVEASNFEVVERSLWDDTNTLKEHNAILEKERNALDVKVTEFEASAASKERELTDLNALVTYVKSQNENLADRIRAFILRLLRRDKAIEKGMQDGLSAGITHGKEGRVLTDVAAHNPSTKVDYIYALQQLQNVNFSLLAELKYSKDASVKTVMDILGLEGPLAEKLGLNELQSNVDQLMVPIHRSPDQVVVGATALSLALDVSKVWVRKIKENIAIHRSALHDVFIPLAKPLSAAVLTGTEGTSNTATATADITMALSTTFAYACSIAPISIDDYEVVGADDQAVADENAASFPNVDDAELNIPQ